MKISKNYFKNKIQIIFFKCKKKHFFLYHFIFTFLSSFTYNKIINMQKRRHVIKSHID